MDEEVLRDVVTLLHPDPDVEGFPDPERAAVLLAQARQRRKDAETEMRAAGLDVAGTEPVLVALADRREVIAEAKDQMHMLIAYSRGPAPSPGRHTLDELAEHSGLSPTSVRRFAGDDRATAGVRDVLARHHGGGDPEVDAMRAIVQASAQDRQDVMTAVLEGLPAPARTRVRGWASDRFGAGSR
ncbi:hypothetical protein AB0I28_32440 [Phytomonospora sp. NPDC050363]|uniref:hypothetical protein n=1 Tax=Phytomonospora sp. NPDC050363 TaxID=3155642 RepID=UPI0033E84AC9